MTQETIDSIQELLTKAQPNGFTKLCAKMSDEKQIDQKLFFYLFAITVRWFDKSPVDLSHSSFWQEKDQYGVISRWQWPNLARLYLLLLISERKPKEEYVDLFKSLFNSSDMQESITLIQSLAFLPHAEAFEGKAREAARSNITTLFCSGAHHSDYAFKHFDEPGWNHPILKAAFLDVPIHNIHGLKTRNNPFLVTMLRDYAKERQTASRYVPWGLWCCIAWLADSGESLEDLKSQFSAGDIKTKACIGLALSENKHEPAAALGAKLLQSDELCALSSPLTWDAIASYAD